MDQLEWWRHHEAQIEPGEGGGSRGCQVQPKVAEGHGLYEKVICLDCLI